MTTPLYPTYSGPTVLTENWTLTLPDDFEGRLQDGLLTFRRGDLTIWINALGTQDGKTVAERMDRDRASAGPDATGLTEIIDNGVGRLSYEVSETRADGAPVFSLYTYTHADMAQVMIAFYFEDRTQAAQARAIYDTLEYTGA